MGEVQTDCAPVATAGSESSGGEALESQQPRSPIPSPQSDTPSLTAMLHVLEQKMLSGDTELACRAWAIELGVPSITFQRMRALVFETWRRDTTTVVGAHRLREELVIKLNEVYKRAMAKGRLQDAMDALDKIAEITLIKAPTIMVTTPGAAITNASRERAVELLERAKDLAARKQSQLTTTGQDNRVIDVASAYATNGKSNGHR